MINQPFEPVYNEESRVLILGSFPSVKSREDGFYYGHKQNRFWKVLAKVFDVEIPNSIEEKRKMLIDHRIAIWDVIESCDITGSADSSIKNVVPADIPRILRHTKIKKIYVNGTLAKNLYDKHIAPNTGVEAILLPSTSPANARYNLDMLIECWKIVHWEDC